MKKTFPPEFSAVMAHYRYIAAGLGRDHPISRRLLLIAMQLAPDWFAAEMHTMAREMGLLPEATLCDDNGKKFFSLSDVAERLGVSPSEAVAKIERLQADAKAAGTPFEVYRQDVSDLHPLH